MHLFVLEVLWVDVHLPCLKDSQTLSWKEVPTLKNLSRVQAAESFLLLKKVPNHLLRMANWVVNHWLSVLVLVSDI